MSQYNYCPLYSPLPLKKSKLGAEAVYIPKYWKNLDTYLNKNGWYIKKTPGDGFCLLSSILACLQNDHKINMSIENAKQLILEQLIDHHDMYVKFQTFDKRNQGDRRTDSDVLVEEILDFYLGQNYTKNVVGLIVKLASDALGINIYIFQNSDGQILRVRSLGGLACKDVFVKFTHNPIHNLGNHYDAILMKPDFQNLDLLLNAAVSEIIEPKYVNKKPPPAHHQLPSSTQLQSPSLPNASLPEEYDSQPLDLSTKNTPIVPKCQTPLNDIEDEIPVVEDGNGVHEDEIPAVEDGNGVHEDEIPVVEDENIVVIDGVHEDEDDDFKTPYCPRNLRTLEHQHKNSEDGKIPKIGRGNYFPTHLLKMSMLKL